MNKWKPINFRGNIFYDPRQELEARVRYAEKINDTYVSVPIELAKACVELRECDAKTVISADEDGPMTPLEIKCRKPEGHSYGHYNGYLNWD